MLGPGTMRHVWLISSTPSTKLAPSQAGLIMVCNKINEIKELERSLGLILKTFLPSNSEWYSLIATAQLKNFVLDLKLVCSNRALSSFQIIMFGGNCKHFLDRNFCQNFARSRKSWQKVSFLLWKTWRLLSKYAVRGNLAKLSF